MMNKKKSIGLLGAAVLLLAGSHLAQAQEAAAGGVINLPKDVRRVISIDAHNVLLAETGDPATPEESEYTALIVRHVYSGGIARILGGTVIPTEIFVSPAFNKGGFGGGNPSGITSIGGNGFNNSGNGFGNANGLNGGVMNQFVNRLDRAPQQVQVGQ